jgi:hypothetical protein
MAVVRLRGGGLLVWSPTALTDALRVEVDRLGAVRHLVAPNSLHHRFLGQWRTAYPRAAVHAAPGLAGKLRVTELGDTPAAAWVGDLDQAVVRGNRITTEVVFFHRPSGNGAVHRPDPAFSERLVPRLARPDRPPLT